MADILDGPIVDKGECLVLIALANHADDEGYCYPSIARIASQARMTDRGVQKVIKRLCERGDLIIQNGGGRGGTNRYKITDKPRTPFTPELSSPPNPSALNPEPRDINPEPERINPEPRSPETLRNVKETSKKQKPVRKPVDILADVIPEETAQAFIEMRKSVRAPVTVHSANLLAKKLRTAECPVACANLSIENGWRGVFPESPQLKKESGNDSRSNSSAANNDPAIRAISRVVGMGRA